MKDLKLDPERCANCGWMRKRDMIQPLPPPPGEKDEGIGMVVMMLFCHRFPTVLKTESQHWCGEWKEKETKLI